MNPRIILYKKGYFRILRKIYRENLVIGKIKRVVKSIRGQMRKFGGPNGKTRRKI